MPKKWYEIPYEAEEHGSSGIVSRYLALNHFQEELREAGGYADEVEIDAGSLDGPNFGKALTVIRAPSAFHNKVNKEFKEIDDPVASYIPERGHPHLDLTFKNKPLEEADKNVLSDEDYSELKRKCEAVIKQIEKEGYVRLKRESLRRATDYMLLSMLFAKGFDQSKASFGTYPTNRTVIDDFNRANNSDLGTNWTAMYAAMAVLSNQATANPNNYAGEYLNTITPGPNSEAWHQITTVGGTESTGPFCRMNPATFAGYHLHCTASLIRIFRLNSQFSETELGSDISQTISANNYVGIEAYGSSISAYYSSGTVDTFGLAGTRTDSTHTAAGRIGIFPWWFDWMMDNFGGGTIIAAPLLAPSRSAMRVVLSM